MKHPLMRYTTADMAEDGVTRIVMPRSVPTRMKTDHLSDPICDHCGRPIRKWLKTGVRVGERFYHEGCVQHNERNDDARRP